MPSIVVQASFNAGEWSPALYARVDLAKYKSGAALLENFFVDYRGGASTRMGSKYILQAYKSQYPVRLITFQASFNVGYILEFGQNYLRFYFQGAPVLETALNITGVTRANPVGITVAAPWTAGEWIYITGINGTTQLNGNYYQVIANTAGSVTLADLNGTPIDGTAFTAWVSGGTAARIYTISTPYAAADLALVKFAQVTNQMILCHPNYAPQVLSLVTATNWTLAAAVFGSTASAPTSVAVSTTLPPANPSGGGSVGYSYVVTAIDSNGQESSPSTAATVKAADIRTTSGTNQITWSPTAGAHGYNVYESYVSYFGVVPAGVNYGFIGTVTGTTFTDSNITPDFAESPPVAQNPFVGSGIAYVTMTANGTYTSVPTASAVGGSPSIPAVLQPVLGANYTPAVTAGGAGYVVGDKVNFGNGVLMEVTAIGGGGAITTWTMTANGNITTGSTPANPVAQVSTSGAGTGATMTATWGVSYVVVINPGAGFSSTPTITFSAGAATATATLGATSNGNPAVPAFCQQRLILAGQPGAPQTFHASQPGAYYNFDITAPAQASNAITETLVSNTQETIKAIASFSSGMIVFTDKAMWLVNGANGAAGISATSITANRQSTNGCNDMPPIVINYSALFVNSKGFSVYEAAYNIYFTTFTSSDITTIASHLFFGYNLTEWAWADQPFHIVWAVRSDGVMLSLTYLKEQEFSAWSHHVTNGSYLSIASVTETTPSLGAADSVYTVVQRAINGRTVKYIERFADRIFPNGIASAWCVDAGVQYTGPGALSFTGAQHLANTQITALCIDNLGNPTVQTPTVSATGGFTLPAPAAPAVNYTTVTAGLPFTCKLQTLAIDAGQDPIQNKLKRIPEVSIRVKDTLGLTIGSSFTNQVAMKDLVIGAVSSMLTGLGNQIVTDLVTGDAVTIINPTYNVYGQYCIQQSNPFPATVLGVLPVLVLGDVD